MNKLQQKIQSIVLCVALTALVFFCFLNVSFSQEYNSSNFKVLDPVVTGGGGYSSSADYKLDSSISQIGIGTSSAADFKINAGFLYFPYITTPIVSATAGDTQATLSWTVASGVLGWTASGYNVGISTVSGGPYTFSSSLGNVLSSTRTSLSNGTTYYFVIRVEDIFGNIIATSTQTSAIPTTTTTPPASGGGGGFYNSPTVIFSGRAYPRSTVTLLKDAQVVAFAVADLDANFQIILFGVSSGSYFFSVYSEDYSGNKSSLLTFPVNVTINAITNINGIFIAPTIAIDKSEAKRGDNIAIFGLSAPLADIIISIYADEENFVKTSSDKNGIYLYNFDTSQTNYGQHNVKSKASLDQTMSDFSKVISFDIGVKNTPITITKCPARSDLNNDCRVNLVDFSIASYWYKATLNDAFKKIETEKLNGDGKVNLVDFSIMAYYWTG
ncbi:MAG: hypothetical protein ABIF22_03065 [bacterium]